MSGDGMALTGAMQGALVETSCLGAIRDHVSKSATYPHELRRVYRSVHYGVLQVLSTRPGTLREAGV
jgi:hypothetical protein